MRRNAISSVIDRGDRRAQPAAPAKHVTRTVDVDAERHEQHVLVDHHICPSVAATNRRLVPRYEIVGQRFERARVAPRRHADEHLVPELNRAGFPGGS
ncbi:MAG: hypothetical protein AB7T06_25810 [Kofleriaceae bacterium]